MSLPRPSADAQITFLRHVQRLLEEGQFVATYKFALLHAIADLCLLRGDDTGAELKLTTRDIAERYIELYWRQASPFPSRTDELIVLKQSADRNAAVLRQLEGVRAAHPSLARLRTDRQAWPRLLGRVEGTIRKMPLWKLQTVGAGMIEFLYPNVGSGTSITLKPGVMFNMRSFHGLITDLIRGAWMRHVRRYNAAALGHGVDLSAFMFGHGRAALEMYRPILEPAQAGRCFYCEKLFRNDVVQVDHFIPWARYPSDFAHNFVLAHGACNNAKSDHLAAEHHLGRWVQFHQDHGTTLTEGFNAAGVVHDRAASHQVAAWAYGQLDAVHGQAWMSAKSFGSLTGSWRTLLAAQREPQAT